MPMFCTSTFLTYKLWRFVYLFSYFENIFSSKNKCEYSFAQFLLKRIIDYKPQFLNIIIPLELQIMETPVRKLAQIQTTSGQT